MCDRMIKGSPERGNVLTQFEQRVAGDKWWWGVTIGSLVWAVRAEDANEAVNLVYLKIGVPRNENPALVIWHPHEDNFQEALNGRFGQDKQAIRVVPFTMDPWPSPDKTSAN